MAPRLDRAAQIIGGHCSEGDDEEDDHHQLDQDFLNNNDHEQQNQINDRSKPDAVASTTAIKSPFPNPNCSNVPFLPPTCCPVPSFLPFYTNRPVTLSKKSPSPSKSSSSSSSDHRRRHDNDHHRFRSDGSDDQLSDLYSSEDELINVVDNDDDDDDEAEAEEMPQDLSLKHRYHVRGQSPMSSEFEHEEEDCLNGRQEVVEGQDKMSRRRRVTTNNKQTIEAQNWLVCSFPRRLPRLRIPSRPQDTMTVPMTETWTVTTNLNSRICPYQGIKVRCTGGQKVWKVTRGQQTRKKLFLLHPMLSMFL